MIKDQELFFSVPEVEVLFINELLEKGVEELLSLRLSVGSIIVFSLCRGGNKCHIECKHGSSQLEFL